MAETTVNEGQQYMLQKSFQKASSLVNEQQTIDITGVPTGGTFTLTYEGQETSALDYNCTSGQMQTALRALSTITSSNINVTGSNPNFTAEFVSALAATPVDTIKLGTNSLTGGSSPSVTITRTQTGSGTIRQYLYVGVSKSTRETLGDAVTMASINEQDGTGYSRQRVKTDGTTELAITLSGGFYQVRTKVVTFSNTGGSSWSAIKAIFLTDQPTGTTGKVLTIRTVSDQTVLAGQSIDMDLTEQAADPA